MSKSLTPVICAAAALGVGWFLYEQGIIGKRIVRTNTTNTPGTVVPTAQTAYASQGAAVGGLVGSVLNLASKLPFFGSTGSAAGTIDGRAATAWDATPYGAQGPSFNNPSAYVASANADGIPYNPVNSPGVTFASEEPTAYGW